MTRRKRPSLLLDKKRVDAATDAMVRAAYESGCNLLETAQAARAVQAGAMAAMAQRLESSRSESPGRRE